MAVIKKKIWPKWFQEVKKGKKRFELRLADFRITKGDTFVMAEWNPKTGKYTGREMRKKVYYVGRFGLNDFGQQKQIEKKGLYVIQF